MPLTYLKNIYTTLATVLDSYATCAFASVGGMKIICKQYTPLNKNQAGRMIFTHPPPHIFTAFSLNSNMRRK